MTLREVTAALWRRKWIIVAVTLLAAMVAAIYLSRIEPNYESSTTARASTFLTDSISAGAIAGVPADVDPSIITTPAILADAAELIGEPASALVGAVTYEVVEGMRTNTLVVTGSGPTPEAAQDRARAVMTAYSNYVASLIETTLATLQQSVTDTTAEIRNFQSQLANNPDDPIAAQNLATALGDLSGLNSQITTIQNAGPPLTVTSAAPLGTSTNPSTLVVAAIALLCGLLAGAGIALIRDHFDDRIRTADEIESLTGVPTIAELANDRKVARHKLRLPAASSERTALSEGIRSLRTTVQVLLPQGKGAVVVTSVEPGDGKTFVSSNLAVSWARAGRKVTLVGGDLRRPQLDNYFADLDDRSGLGRLLTDAAENRRPPNQSLISDSLVTTPFRGLRVLPPGSDVDEPADLLAGPYLERIVAFLRKSVDIVVIDSPPALALADASELASHATGVILLATLNRTRSGLLRDTVENLRANGVEVLGVVANRSRRTLPKSYSSYYVSRPSQPRIGARVTSAASPLGGAPGPDILNLGVAPTHADAPSDLTDNAALFPSKEGSEQQVDEYDDVDELFAIEDGEFTAGDDDDIFDSGPLGATGSLRRDGRRKSTDPVVDEDRPA